MVAVQRRMRFSGGIKLVALLLASPALAAATLPYEDGGEFRPGPGADAAADAADAVARAGGSDWRSNLPGLGAPIADDELGDMRGKFISPNAVSYFGISMLTSWQDESGITTIARLAFNVDFLVPSGGGPAVPTLFVSWVRDGDPGMDVSGMSDGYVAVATQPDQVIPVGALSTVGGAAQAHVIAGADNMAGNSMRIAIVPRSALPEMDTRGLRPITSTLGMTFQDGDGLQFRLGNNELGMVLTGNGGLDSTMQTIGGDMGQVLQQTILNSDHNNVMNSASIIFGVNDQVRDLERVGATGAMSVLKGFGL